MNNLLKRSIFGLLYGAAMVLGLLCSQVFPFLAVTVLILSLLEFYKVSLGDADLKWERLSACLAALSFFCFTYCILRFGLPLKFMALTLLPLIAINVSFIFSKHHDRYDKLAYLYFGLIYVALPVGLSPILVFNSGEYCGRLFLGLFILIWMSDMGAYFIGSALGQRPGARKLAPAISPKKSWWGVAGGLLFAIIAAIVLNLTGWFNFSLPHSIILSVIVCAAAIAGDLCESVWKRHFGIKDSGNLIPGHGGMMDRFDSALIAIPAAALYLSLFSLL